LLVGNTTVPSLNFHLKPDHDKNRACVHFYHVFMKLAVFFKGDPGVLDNAFEQHFSKQH
jgi:hypothetical protein